MKQKETWYILFICISIISSNSFSQHASFQGLGDFPGGTFNSTAQKVSTDGSVIIGYGVTASGEQAFRWTEGSGMVSLGNLPDTSFKKSWANGVSANGNVIVGYGDPVGSGWNTYKGFLWTDSGGMMEMGSLDSSTRCMAFSVSADGSVIAGDGGPEAFRWREETGIEGLGVLPGKTNSRAIDISNDGSVIIGQSYTLPAWNDEDGFIWTQSGGMRGMASLTGGKYCMLLVISPDGSVIGGTTQSSSTYPAFFWTESRGMVTIGHLPGRNTTHPTDMTPFGKIIVGGSFSGPTSGDAFIWDSTNGMRKLQTVLQTEYGLNLTGWTLQNASSITSDGNVIVGHGINPSGKQEAFRVVLDTLISNKYLGQTPPGDTPVIFAPGILSTSAREHHGPAISPDGKEIYWSVQTVTDDTVYKTKLMFSRFIDNNWTEPAEVPFSHEEHEQPVFSPDGNSLYFLRVDSLPSGEIKLHIVCYTKHGDEWANPVTICEGVFASITSNGTIYYCGLSGNRIAGIFRLTKKDGVYSEPEQLPVQINKPNTMNWTPYIAPDESYIIFSRLNSSGDWGELMISFRDSSAKTWTEPQNIGSPVNTSSQERQPRVSPDGKYLFFSRWISDNNEVIFWVSSRIIERLKPGTSSTIENEDRNKELQLNLFQNYPNPFNPATTIRYSLNKASHVTLSVYNLLGQEIKILKNEFQNAGEYSIVWNANDEHGRHLTSGIYFCTIKTQNSIVGRKMVLVR